MVTRWVGERLKSVAAKPKKVAARVAARQGGGKTSQKITPREMRDIMGLLTMLHRHHWTLWCLQIIEERRGGGTEIETEINIATETEEAEG